MRVLYLSLVIVIADQLTKLFVKGFSIPFLKFSHEGMYHGQRIPVIGDFFRFTFIENPGMAFGFDPGIDYKLLVSLFSLAASIGLVFYIYYVRNSSSKSLKIALALILGGAAGNLIDRMFYGVFFDYAPLFYGKVVDFLDFDFFNLTIFGKSYDRWPIFNIADAAVTVGVFILIVFYKQHQEADKKTEEKTGTTAPGEVTEENIILTNPDVEENTADGSSVITTKEDNTTNGEPDKGKEIPL